MKSVLGELCTFQAGGAFPRHEQGHLSGDHPFIKVSDMTLPANSTRIVEANNWVSAETAARMKLKLTPPGAVAFAKIGEGLKAERLRRITVPTAMDNNMMAAIPKPAVVDSGFLLYLIESVHIAEWAQGSALPYLSQKVLADIPVHVPSLPEQRAIAATLGALDDKIESNRRLAERASAVIDASASQLLARTSTEVLPLADLVEFNRLSVNPHSTDALRYIDIASVSSGQIDSVQELTWDEAPSRARRGVSDGDVIYSTVRPGNRAFVLIVDPTPGSVASTGFAVMSPSVRLGSSMLTSVVGAPEFAEYLESVAHGSAYPAVGIQAMGNYSVVVPKEAVVAEQFEAETMPLRRRVAQARAESERLAALRDTLLPELLSGRMRVPVEGAAA